MALILWGISEYYYLVWRVFWTHLCGSQGHVIPPMW
jgi:hypothetical protein